MKTKNLDEDDANKSVAPPLPVTASTCFQKQVLLQRFPIALPATLVTLTPTSVALCPTQVALRATSVTLLATQAMLPPTSVALLAT